MRSKFNIEYQELASINLRVLMVVESIEIIIFPLLNFWYLKFLTIIMNINIHLIKIL